MFAGPAPSRGASNQSNELTEVYRPQTRRAIYALSVPELPEVEITARRLDERPAREPRSNLRSRRG